MDDKTYKCTLGGQTYTVVLVKAYYGNGRTAIKLEDARTGEPITKVTVNLQDEDELGEGEVFVKNWSENEGIEKFLADNKIAEPTGRTVPSGHVDVPVYKLLI